MTDQKLLERNARALFYWVRDHMQARSPYPTPDTILFRGIVEPSVVSNWKRRGDFAHNMSTVVRLAKKTGLPLGSMFGILLTEELDYASLSLSRYRKEIENGKPRRSKKEKPSGV